ncbi:unnamed protein product [Rotaria socialis]|uniref:Uncharacterized protein n=1 Tax=Rotaria socialis TaxID=392032 RepID=A0A821VW57_9BILA|nr:unnamed protein product [Rotaria socialis]CAF4914157.1 unnamed protein product [Rotaria socialis]
MRDIENNCSKLLQKYPNLINLPDILPTCWRVHGFYRYGKLVVVLLIVHDCVSMYLVSGGPFSYFFMSMIIGILSILGVYVSQMGLILVIDFIYVILGFNQSKNKLINGLQLEQTKINSCQNQTESLTNEIHELQKTLNEFKNEKNESIQNKMDGGENDERQNLVRHITEEKIKYFFSYSKFNSFLIVKDQYDQQNKRNR